MIRVLMVVGSLDCGGAESLVMNLFRNIDRTKIVFDFAVHTEHRGFFADEVEKLGGKIYHFPKYRIINGAKFKKCWNNFFKEHKDEYQIIHTHHSSSVAIILKIAKKYGLYTIAHSHSAGWDKSLMGFGNMLLSRGTRRVADHFFACSYIAAVAEFGKKVADDKSRCDIIANGVPADKYIFNSDVRKKMRKEIGIPGDVHLYGHVGRFVYAKNHQYLIKVFNEILKKDPSSYLLLLGDGELKNDIVSQVEKLGIKDHVLMPGLVKNVNDYLQAMDYFIFPSNYEGLPVVLVEAQASGLRVLKSDVITNEVDVTDLVDALSIQEEPSVWAEKILQNVDYYRQNTYEIIKKAGFDISSSVDYLTKFYLDIIANGGKTNEHK